MKILHNKTNQKIIMQDISNHKNGLALNETKNENHYLFEINQALRKYINKKGSAFNEI